MAPKKKPARTQDETDAAEDYDRPRKPYDENDPEVRGDVAERAERFVSESWGYQGPDE